jgi:hypothetical protein
MTLAALKIFLLWSLGFHTLLLTLWFFLFVGAHDWMYRLHTRWFQLSVETVNQHGNFSRCQRRKVSSCG